MVGRRARTRPGAFGVRRELDDLRNRFFCQAEDGIRDDLVTGVQTCALPILQRLHKKGFPHVARYRGELALGKGSDRLVLGVATDLAETTDAFSWLTGGWREEFGAASEGGFERESLDFARALGEATARLHEALTDGHPGLFRAEPFTEEDAEGTTRAALGNLSDALRRLAALAKGPDPRLGGLAAQGRELVFAGRERIELALEGVEEGIGTVKGVTHADFHLAQVLRPVRGDLLFVDFEGEPERGPGQRDTKMPPLRDVATMNRSFAYVKHYAWREATKGDATAAWRFLHRQEWSPAEETIAYRLTAWESSAVERFTREYMVHAKAYESVDAETAWRVIRGWEIEKALYELRYELKHRPQNIFIPLEGVMSLAASGGRRPSA